MANPTPVLNKFLVDAGILYVSSAPGSWVPVAWGATRGGLTFDPAMAFRTPEADGITTPIDGTGRVTRYDSVITGRIMDATKASLSRMLPGSTSDGSASNSVITPVPARQFITTGQSIRDVLLIHRNSNNEYQATYFPKGLVTKWTKASSDSDEGLFDITITAMLLATQSPNDAPFREIVNFDLDSFDPSSFHV